MISYAQNAEDVVLARLFRTQSEGRYVDVGAGDPVEDSVTKHFYEKGWSGINIEPVPELADRLRKARPRDVTLQLALGATKGKATLHVVPDAWGRATLDERLAQRYRERERWRVEDVETEITTLAAVLDEHPGDVDFLKVDVEGAEREVFEGADWTRHRPRVLLVEATEPGSPTPAHEQWEPILLDAGYRCALFDGLNRFYAQADDEEALACLSVPANVFDEFERHEVARMREQAEKTAVARAGESGYIRRLEQRLQQEQKERERDAAYLATLEKAVEAERRHAAKAARYFSALEKRIAELEAAARTSAQYIAMLENKLNQ
ncbi:FkbM family methyltransferase [Saccharomonospora glauca]|jgi:FkbM family methyltransferase|uniref:Methyltransferase, FkbM family n=1 Tax=Saccharomonospora glauca K62 TaxID=928724 RepID=I1CWL7_9PSEU|nr:FkbM family methyltransferase [Saccharomonospora glauca]EIE97091.1 methyltransferase, FkbM family [Saccharomonospora glauca K62]